MSKKTTNIKFQFRIVVGNGMTAVNPVLDKIPDKKRGMGAVLCLIDKKTYLRENLVALPIEYV